MALKPHLAFNSKDGYVINMDTLASDGYQNDMALSICLCSRGVCRDVYIESHDTFMLKRRRTQNLSLSDDDDGI
jgi:hypothetical protein